MQNKIRNYVYRNDANYSSYDSMKSLFVCIFPFISLVAGTCAVVTKLWWGLCVLAALDAAFLIHLVVLRKIKKTYRLRFLSESIIATLLSLLFLSCAFIVLFAAGYNSPGLVCGALISYVLFTILVLAYTVFCSKSDSFQRTQGEKPKKHLLFFGALIPCSGVIGMVIAKVIFKTFDFGNQVAAYVCFAIFTIISFVFAFGYPNYVKYYYCKKYKILCDENGNTTSSELEPAKKRKQGQDK